MSGAGLARVALKAFSVGVDKVPDKYWHKIPIFKPQEEKDKEKRQRHRQRRKGRSSSESSGSDYQPEEEDYDDHRSVRAHEDDSGPRLNQTQRHSSQEHHARHHGASLPYSINNATSKQKESDDPIPTFTTPSYIPVPMSDYPYDSRPQGEPHYRKYNPADYEPSANDRGQNQRGYYQSNGQPQSTSNAYQPSNYPSYQQQDFSSRGQYSGAPARYNDSYSNENARRDSEQRDRRSDGRKKPKSSRRRRSRSRSRSSSSSDSEDGLGTTGKIKKKFDTSSTGMATAAIGAIAGGILGNEFGKSPLATVAGVAIGGLGANFFEAKDHQKKIERIERKKRSKSRQRNKSRDRSSGGYGGRRSGYNSGSDDEYSDEGRRQPQQRSSEQRRDRSSQRQHDSKPLRWKNVLE